MIKTLQESLKLKDDQLNTLKDSLTLKDDQIKTLEESLNLKAEKIDTLEKTLKLKEEQLSSQSASSADDSAIEDLQKEIEVLSGELAKADEDIEALEKELEKAEIPGRRLDKRGYGGHTGRRHRPDKPVFHSHGGGAEAVGRRFADVNYAKNGGGCGAIHVYNHRIDTPGTRERLPHPGPGGPGREIHIQFQVFELA